MRMLLIIILIAGGLYWLSGQGIVSFDNTKAKSYINNALDKIDPKSTEKTASSNEIDYEVNRLCSELKDLSDRSLRLRRKLLSNVSESANPKKS